MASFQIATISFQKALFIFLVSCFVFVAGARNGESHEEPRSNSTDATPKCDPNKKVECLEGILLPLWYPQKNLSGGDKAARAFIYFAALCYMFLGVSIIADRFMAAIEVITSKEKEVTIKKPNGETTVVNVRIWNETVSNLTLMALGSSAPEILLSVIEIIGKNFIAGELGPGTIVGSAAYNMFVIIAICVYVIPNDEVRKIKHPRVFFITASWSLFAYIWLYIILAVSSYGVIEIWEGILTLLFFPATVLTAYIADQKIFNKLTKKYRKSKRGEVVVQTEGEDLEMATTDLKVNHIGGEEETFKAAGAIEGDEIKEFEEQRHEYIQILRELRHKHPDATMEALEHMANYEGMNRGPKSRAFYRIQATRKMMGAGNVLRRKMDKHSSLQDIKVQASEDENVTKVFFDPGHYTVMENVGQFNVTVARNGGDLNSVLYVDYTTEDGSANAGSDYELAEGTLKFEPGETRKQFSIAVMDDDVFEEDEHFFVRLSNIRVGSADGKVTSNHHDAIKAKLGEPSLAMVMILDDDHSGIFCFEHPNYEVVESIGDLHIRVTRHSGARGQVRIPYRTVDGAAKGGGKDYDDAKGDLIFENDETEKIITIGIIDHEDYEKNEAFIIELGEPKLITVETTELRGGSDSDDSGAVEDENSSRNFSEMTEEQRIADLGKPRLGEPNRCEVHIKESKEFKNTVDKLIKKADISLIVGTSSWREQFIDAITVVAGDDDGDEEGGGEEKLPSCGDYVMHFLTFFWKVLFAFVPPTDYWGGWLCFMVSICVIGLLTAIIGDLAGYFGCSIGLKDTVTAISFVALGTSIPDTFASKVAAIGDKYADSSIGNVTGSNAVNVFLGIGLAWTIASIYHAIKGVPFHVNPGSLAFSVTIFCIFALVCIFVLVLRRLPFVGGELGGPVKYRLPTAILFLLLWITYLLLSSMESYCHIKGF